MSIAGATRPVAKNATQHMIQSERVRIVRGHAWPIAELAETATDLDDLPRSASMLVPLTNELISQLGKYLFAIVGLLIGDHFAIFTCIVRNCFSLSVERC